jgi:hypothetical protein
MNVPFALLFSVLAAADVTRPSPSVLPSAPAAASAACDEVVALVATTPGITLKRSIGPFHDSRGDRDLFGCRVEISGSFAAVEGQKDAIQRLRDGLPVKGWSEDSDYSADGKDGTQFAVSRGRAGCILEGRWDGGADGEPEIAPRDWYKLTIVCTEPFERLPAQP